MLLLSLLIAVALLLMLGVRIAASPPFAFIGRLFTSWADRCHDAETPRRR